MRKIEEKLKNDYLFGFINYGNEINFYLMPVAFWILNYHKYDPTFDSQKWNYIFRNNILNVTKDRTQDYLESIQEDKVDIEEMSRYISAKNQMIELNFFVDFDKRLFVNGFFDIAVEDYLPDAEWKGLFDSPENFLPNNLKLQMKI